MKTQPLKTSLIVGMLIAILTASVICFYNQRNVPVARFTSQRPTIESSVNDPQRLSAPIANVAHTTKAQDPRDRTKAEISAAESEIDNCFGSVLGTFHLSPQELMGIRKLLVERLLAHRDLAAMRNTKDQKFLIATIKLQPVIDLEYAQEIRNSLSEEQAKLVLEMLSVESTLSGMQRGSLVTLKTMGIPLNGDQIFSVAKISAAVFGQNRPMPAGYATTIDRQTMLSALDETYLQQLSAFLSTSQLAVYKEQIISRNRDVLSALNNPNR